MAEDILDSLGMEGGGYLGLFSQWVFSGLNVLFLLSSLFVCKRSLSSFANVPSFLSGDVAMNSGNRKAFFAPHRWSKRGTQTQTQDQQGCVVDIDAALGDRSAAITSGVGVTPGPLPFSSSGNETLQIP